jgi:hypothetical protein
VEQLHQQQAGPVRRADGLLLLSRRG